MSLVWVPQEEGLSTLLRWMVHVLHHEGCLGAPPSEVLLIGLGDLDRRIPQVDLLDLLFRTRLLSLELLT